MIIVKKYIYIYIDNTKSKRKVKMITNPPKKTPTLVTDEEARV